MGTQLSVLKGARGDASERAWYSNFEAAEASLLHRKEKKDEKTKGPSAFQVCSRLVRGSIYSAYDVSCRVLGQGTGGPLYAARSKLTGRQCCVKFFRKTASGLGAPSRTAVLKIRNELKVRVRVDHPNIARLIEIYEDEKQLAIVLEYCSGGDLFSHLCARGRFPEQTARALVHQMLTVLYYLHSHDVVHRDLRLEKWVVAPEAGGDSEDGGASFLAGPVKLVDLGSATVWRNKSRKLDVACGALPYASPDMLVGRYTQACDLWSLGVITYMLLSGHPPFHGRQQTLVSQILSAAYTTHTLGWEGVSDEARDFVERLMDVDPVRRMTVDEALTHVWMASIEPIRDFPLSLDFLVAVKKFARCSKLRRAILTMMAYSVTTEAAGANLVFFLLPLRVPRRGVSPVFLAAASTGGSRDRTKNLDPVDKDIQDSPAEVLDRWFYIPRLSSCTCVPQLSLPALASSPLVSVLAPSLARRVSGAAVPASLLVSADLEKLFFAFCKPPKATLGLDEFLSAMKTHFPFLDIGQMVRIFQAMDSSCEKEISYNDFLAAMLKPQLEKEDLLLVHTFHKWDADRSGVISLDDLRVLLGDRYGNDILEDMMHDFDINGNGHIDLDEFVEAVRDDEDEFESYSRDGYAEFLASPAAARRLHQTGR
ncbi:putative CAM kinase, CDPK family [Neospora caninum Liverpool]|uniref:Putative CAM kinase, CDPK family n=1 Tax=Neospora caninum (strain Liverpool) TaxID=572307 RepID=F0V7N0_NEOCL|nr:putative CAM kinase, CDPK family [Neospora caninum Liverpool]CBZ49721.1 putative CAM kinase, CDPK family [Neospora caninum Liverpool]|eukprot:XP_003879756.1 putative CAM kinase, CDPK family [Neospora caninum Liverpool]